MALRTVFTQSQDGDVDTGVTIIDIDELLTEAEMIEWDRAPRMLMLEWMEKAANIFQMMLEEPQCNPFERAQNAEIA